MSTNIPRITQKIFAQNAAEDDLLQFGSVLSGNATPSTSIAETQTEAYQTGWRSAVISDRNYPTLGEMNAVQQVPTQQLAYLFQKGVPEWDASTTYFANVSYCQVNGVIYKSLTDNNIGNNPTTDSGTNWIIADFSNKLTNCILAAPNGVATYSGNTITIKQGLKVLIPNERNADKSLKNIELTLDEDISRSGELKNTTGSLLIGSDKTLSINKYIEGYVLPSNFTGVFRNLDENTCYFYSNGTPQKERSYANIGNGSTDAEGNVTSLNPYQPVELAKEQDLDGNWTYKRMTLFQETQLPANYNKTFDLSSYLPNDGKTYEIILSYMGRTDDVIGSQFELGYTTDIIPYFTYAIRNVSRTANSVTSCGNSIALIGQARTITVLQGAAAAGTSGNCAFFIQAYRKVR